MHTTQKTNINNSNNVKNSKKDLVHEILATRSSSQPNDSVDFLDEMLMRKEFSE